MTSLLDMGVSQNSRGAHWNIFIAAKAELAFEECMSDEYMEYILQVKLNWHPFNGR